MLLNKKLEQIGDVFFRYRSYIPLILIAFLFLKINSLRYASYAYFGNLIYEFFCFFISMLGIFIRIYTVGYCKAGTSGRNTKGQYAKNLNSDGIYSVVRNPLYLANFFIFLGVSMLAHSIELIAINTLAFVCFYVPIILREERFLLDSFKDEFVNYTSITPALIPNFKLWKKPGIKFNLIRVLAREHDTFLGIIWGFFVVKAYSDYIVNQRIVFNKIWTSVFVVSWVIWVILKSKKKYLKSIDKGL